MFERGFDLQSGHEINALSLSNITMGVNAKSKKGRVVIFCTRHIASSCFTFLPSTIKNSKGYSSYRADTKSISNKTKGNNSKSKIARIVNFVHDTLSCPVLHFYQVSSKYSQVCSSYRADKKFYADADAEADANGIRLQNNMSPNPSVGGGGT